MRTRWFVAAVAVSLAMAASASADDMYGALAYNADDGSFGWAVDFPTQKQANAKALKECGDDCEVAMEFQNTCASFAMGSKGAYGWAYAPTKKEAQEMALDYCSERGRNCEVKVWACTTR